MNSSIQKIYEEHHLQHRPRGMVIFENERSRFLVNKIGHDKTILDIGCRDGSLTKHFVKGNRVLGVDIDLEALNYAQSKFNINVKQIDLNGEWNLPEDKFNIVVCAEVLEHLYYPQSVMNKITKVLKKDGVLLGSIPNAFNLKNRIRLLRGVKKGTSLEDSTHINHFSWNELNNLLLQYFNEVNLYPGGRFAKLDKFFPGWASFFIMFEAKNKK